MKRVFPSWNVDILPETALAKILQGLEKGDRDPIDEILRGLGSARRTEREHSAEKLRRILEAAIEVEEDPPAALREMFPELERLLSDAISDEKSAEVLFRCIDCLSWIGHCPEGTEDTLLRHLKHKAAKVRISATRALGKTCRFGDQIIPMLLRALEKEPPDPTSAETDERSVAAEALLNLRDALSPYLDDVLSVVRRFPRSRRELKTKKQELDFVVGRKLRLAVRESGPEGREQLQQLRSSQALLQIPAVDKRKGKKDLPRNQQRVSPGLKSVRVLEHGHEDVLAEIAFSPDGSILASSSMDETIVLWDWRSGTELVRLYGFRGTLKNLLFSRDGMFLFASDDRSIGLYSVASGKLIRRFQTPETEVFVMDLAPDGKRLVSALYLRPEIVLWEVQTGKASAVWETGEDATHTLACSPCGQHIAAAHATGWVGSIQLRDAANGRLRKTITKMEHSAHELVWAPSGKQLAFGADDAKVRVCDVDTRNLLATLKENLPSLTLRYSPDGRLLASRTCSMIYLYRTDTWGRVLSVRDPCWAYPFDGALAFHPTKSVLAARSNEDQTISIWELDYGPLLEGQTRSADRG